MPEDPNATPIGGDKGSDGEPKTQEPAGKPEPFLGTYATKEEAEKGQAEKDKHISKLEEELGHLKSDVLQKLAEAQTAQNQPQAESKPPFDVQGFIKKWEDGDAEFQVNAIMDLINGTAAKGEVEARTKALEEKLQLAEQTLAERIAQVSPDYLAHKDTVAELQKELPNADRDTLLKVAVMMDAQAPSAPPADDPPGGTGSSRVVEPKTGSQLEDWQIEAISKVLPGGLKDGELEKLKGDK